MTSSKKERKWGSGVVITVSVSFYFFFKRIDLRFWWGTQQTREKRQYGHPHLELFLHHWWSQPGSGSLDLSPAFNPLQGLHLLCPACTARADHWHRPPPFSTHEDYWGSRSTHCLGQCWDIPPDALLTVFTALCREMSRFWRASHPTSLLHAS